MRQTSPPGNKCPPRLLFAQQRSPLSFHSKSWGQVSPLDSHGTHSLESCASPRTLENERGPGQDSTHCYGSENWSLTLFDPLAFSWHVAKEVTIQSKGEGGRGGGGPCRQRYPKSPYSSQGSRGLQKCPQRGRQRDPTLFRPEYPNPILTPLAQKMLLKDSLPPSVDCQASENRNVSHSDLSAI